MNKIVNIIKCPECKMIQKANVEQSVPWWTYVHFCKCGNIITESDWIQIKDDNIGLIVDLLV